MNRNLFVALCVSLITTSFIRGDEPKTKSDTDTKTVKARTLSLNVPAKWKQMPQRPMRAAEFSIPADGDKSAALIVYYFGGPTGGIQANVDRWVGQFTTDDRKIEMFQGDCTAGSYIIVDAIGTWNKPDGPPFAQKKIKTPNSRVVNVIVVEKNDTERDYYFMKLSGPKEVVREHIEELRTAIGAKSDTEKPFEMKDADEVVQR